ncbi:MAG: hypothetical protein HOP16_04180 [Acidobacteria bacterium]|nr:hypothetical protein [Acidobacteriota bacterium]
MSAGTNSDRSANEPTKFRNLSDDQVWERWRADIDRVKEDLYELFASRRAFLEVSELFRTNDRLQREGGNVWQWLLVNYASFVVMRIRREVDGQRNVISLNQLFSEVKERPSVITRQRYLTMLRVKAGEPLYVVNDQYFTKRWARPDAVGCADEIIDVERVESDRRALDKATKPVQEVGNRSIAHRQRVEPAELTLPAVDEALRVLEELLKSYYVLLHGASLSQAEPIPQYDTLAVYSFPWASKQHEGDE